MSAPTPDETPEDSPVPAYRYEKPADAYSLSKWEDQPGQLLDLIEAGLADWGDLPTGPVAKRKTAGK